MTARRFDARSHLRKILAPVEIYGEDPTARALEEALTFNAFSSEYIAHLLQARARPRARPVSPLSLTRRADLLELSRNPIRLSTRPKPMSDENSTPDTDDDKSIEPLTKLLMRLQLSNARSHYQELSQTSICARIKKGARIVKATA